MVTPEKPVGTAMGRRPQSIGEEFGGVTIRDDPELGTYFLKPPKCHITIYRFSYWARDPASRVTWVALSRTPRTPPAL